jgi:hypothetical protein
MSLKALYLLDPKIVDLQPNKKVMSLKEENKKLKDCIKALEFIKELQQDIIIDFEKVTRQELAKSIFPKH